MIGRALIALCFIAFVTASESPYQGKIALKPLGDNAKKEIVCKYFDFRPLTEEPKIANLKNNEIQLTLIDEKDTCGNLPFIGDEDATLPMIDLTKIQRLTCGMMLKIASLKKAGYKGFILVLDSQQFIKNHCRMYEDNHFFTGVMNSGNFSSVMDYEKRGAAQSADFKVKGILSIQLYNSNEKLLEVWVNSFNTQSYQALKMLKNSMTQLTTMSRKIQWMPRFATLDCTHGDTAESCKASDYVASCGCKGQFCSPEIRGKTPAPMVQEDIRQLLIFKQYPTKYLEYASLFAQQCLQTYQKEKYVQECATRIMDRLQINSFSINEIVGTFLDSCMEEEKIKQSQIFATLQKDQRAFVSYGRYPLILINKEIIDYKSEQDFKGVLCTKLQLDDQGCFTVIDTTTISSTTTGVLFWILLILTLVGVGAAVVYFYRRRLKRDMNKEIKMQVSTAVQHYFALTDTTSNVR